MKSYSRRISFLFIAGLFGLLLTGILASTMKLAAAEPSGSAMILVSSSLDNVIADDDACTLREAINNANSDSDTTSGDCAAGSGWDVVMIPAGTYTLSVTGADDDTNTTGDLDILDSLTLMGVDSSSTILDGAAADRVLDVDPTNLGVVLDLQNVAVTNGYAEQGGGIRQQYGETIIQDSLLMSNSAELHGGALYAQIGVVHLMSTTIQHNQTISNATTAGGGGLYSKEALLYLENSTVISNNAIGKGAGVFLNHGPIQLVNSQVVGNSASGLRGYGGGIYTYVGNIEISANSSIANNAGRYGGGVYAEYGLVTLVDSRLGENTATIDGGGFYGENNGIVTNNGVVEGNDAGTDGGGIYTNAGTLIEGNSTIQNNSAKYGGGIYAEYGMLIVDSSTIFSNTSTFNGGGIFLAEASLSVRQSIIDDNHATDSGGGIYLGDDYPFIYIADSLIQNNTAGAEGGGIRLSDECSLHLEGSTVRGNSAVDGGGIYIYSECGLYMLNSTISENSAENGGGMYIDHDVAANVEYSTISNNSAATAGGGIYLDLVGLSSDAYLSVRNSVVAGNDVAGSLADASADCFDTLGFLVTGGHNVFGDSTGCPADPRYDQVVIPSAVATSVLFPLADNGGAALPDGNHAPTHALRDGSIAVDMGADLLCPPTDQTGAVRAQGNGCDAGANESEFSAAPFNPTPNLITVTAFSDDLTNNGNCTLREAVEAANHDMAVDACAAGDGWDTIVLSAGTYLLDIPTTHEDNNVDGDLDIITGSITFQGAGESLTIIDAGEDDRVIDQSVKLPTVMTLHDLTLTNGAANIYGGCLFVEAGLTILSQTTIAACRLVNEPSGQGGGIFTNFSTLILQDSTLENNRAREGGGVYAANGPIALFDSAVNNNTSPATGQGAGIYVEHAYLFMDHSEILSNTSPSNGAGYYGYEGGIVMRNDSVVANNVVTDTIRDGGGLYLYSGGFIENSTVSHNSAADDGGGIYAELGGVWIINAVISHNSAGDNGGGLYMEYGGVIESSLFESNNTVDEGGGLHAYLMAHIRDTQFFSNSARYGGGLLNDEGGVAIYNSEFRWNHATISGGGIYADDVGMLIVQSIIQENSSTLGGGMDASAASIAIYESTISHNTAITGGGLSVDTAVALINSTVSGNSAQAGGGFYVADDSIVDDATLYLVYSTVVSNTATNDGGGILHHRNVTVIESSIVAGNSANGSMSDGTADCNAQSPISFAGHSLFGIGTGCLASAPGDQTVPPADIFTLVLTALADHGGITETHALLFGSPAIDAGNERFCPATDQRGYHRPFGVGCDSGGFEYSTYKLFLPFALSTE